MPPLDDLDDVVRVLRGPGGCAWDAAQTPTSLAPYLLEEAAEAVDAVAAGRWTDVADELGDVLFVVASMAQAAEAAGHFVASTPAQRAADKMRRRHPHVFGDADAPPDWDALKRAERGARPGSALDAAPGSLPPVARAAAITDAAARVGFDWPDAEGVWAKLDEEIGELREAATHEARAAELGDLLFTVVNLARHLGVDADVALRGATARFEARFRDVERRALAEGASVATSPAEALDAWWRAAKELVG